MSALFLWKYGTRGGKAVYINPEDVIAILPGTDENPGTLILTREHDILVDEDVEDVVNLVRKAADYEAKS